MTTSSYLSDPFIVADGLRKSYGPQVAVDGLSFEIHRGESFGLLGPNGAGKSTTISMLIGLLAPDAGTVSIFDRDGLAGNPLDPAIRKTIGIAPQSLSLYDELSAHENLEFFGRLYGINGARLSERVAWALDFSGLKDRRKDRVGTYSGGMRRRLNIAVALIHEPTALLLDEPTVGVDPQSRNHIFDSISELKSMGMTILYTTHYMEEAQRLCDRVAIVDHGKLLAIDSVPGLIQSHGGQSVVQVELKPNLDGRDWEPIDNLPGRMEDNRLRFESARPLEAVAELVGKKIPIQSLQITQPDLESVFLSLTGRSLRD